MWLGQFFVFGFLGPGLAAQNAAWMGCAGGVANDDYQLRGDDRVGFGECCWRGAGGRGTEYREFVDRAGVVTGVNRRYRDGGDAMAGIAGFAMARVLPLVLGWIVAALWGQRMVEHGTQTSRCHDSGCFAGAVGGDVAAAASNFARRFRRNDGHGGGDTCCGAGSVVDAGTIGQLLIVRLLFSAVDKKSIATGVLWWRR